MDPTLAWRNNDKSAKVQVAILRKVMGSDCYNHQTDIIDTFTDTISI